LPPELLLKLKRQTKSPYKPFELIVLQKMRLQKK